MRGADTEARQLTPESAGLYALATGFQAMAKDDRDNMVKQFPAYDALYAYCRRWPIEGRGSAHRFAAVVPCACRDAARNT